MIDGAASAMSALTAPELAELPATELVDTVLLRVQEALGVDTAVVLVVEPSGTHLVAHAARGLEDEVLQGFQLAIGAGFSGRIAATRAPMTLDDVRPGTVVNPLILARGVRSMAGVPMVALDRLVGVLHVGSTTPRRFDVDDLALLQVAADRLAGTLAAAQTASERSAAQLLQRSLLPGDLPAVEGVELASRFVPAARFGVGGDWIDAFRLPDDRLGIVLGDVVGSGLRAAVVMGRLRSALRAYALESAQPGEALDRLNRKLMHFEPGEMATVLYLTIAPDRTSFTVALAGHPPPIVAAPGGDARFVACKPNPPIGVDAGRPHADVVVPLPIGTTIACYTDGLYERRVESIDLQLERLRASVFAAHAEDVCSAVMAELIGHHRVEDDTALLVARRTA